MRKFIIGTSLLLALASPALADDNPPSAFHGFFDASFQNDYITPRGLMVTNKGLTTQVLDGLVMLLPGNASLVVGTWNDVDSDQTGTKSGALNEFDWFAGANVTVAKNLKLGAQFVEFISPPGNFNAENNVEFSAAYDDSGWGLPIAIKPYVKLFYAISGDSTVVTGKKGGTYDVEIGIAPSYNVGAIGLSVPTWVTVGPADYWGGSDNIGVFSTGLTAKLPLSSIPSQYGSWYLKAGAQFYDFVNPQLRYAQTLVGTAPFGSGGHQTATIITGGFGFGF